MTSFCCCPPDSLPALVTNYETVGTIVDKDFGSFYAVGTPEGNKPCIIIPDIWGYNGGRTRAVADLVAKTGHYVVVPKVLPPLEGGTGKFINLWIS